MSEFRTELPYQPLLTVVVATYNREKILERCLRSLTEQEADPTQFEVLVVENRCTDGTVALAQRYCSSFSHFKLIHEPNQGLSYSRNQGLKNARGAFVGYIDDDAEAPKSWVSETLKAIEKFPHAVAFGGPYVPYYLDGPPSWFRDGFASWNPGGGIRDFGKKDCFCGSNMVIQRRLLEELGGFAVDLGHCGTKKVYGEESDLHSKIKTRGLPTLFIPDMVVRHLAKPALYSAKYLIKDSFQAGINAGEIGLLGRSKSLAFAKVLATLALAPYYTFFNVDPSLKTRLLFTARPLARRAGYLRGLFRPPHRSANSGSSS